VRKTYFLEQARAGVEFNKCLANDGTEALASGKLVDGAAVIGDEATDSEGSDEEPDDDPSLRVEPKGPAKAVDEDGDKNEDDDEKEDKKSLPLLLLMKLRQKWIRKRKKKNFWHEEGEVVEFDPRLREYKTSVHQPKVSPTEC
jgi:hypothetical protein